MEPLDREVKLVCLDLPVLWVLSVHRDKWVLLDRWDLWVREDPLVPAVVPETLDLTVRRETRDHLVLEESKETPEQSALPDRLEHLVQEVCLEMQDLKDLRDQQGHKDCLGRLGLLGLLALLVQWEILDRQERLATLG